MTEQAKSDYRQTSLFVPIRYGRFRRFHLANPQVFRWFTHFARQAKLRGGRKRFGARMIGERIRWYTSVETDEECPRLNDHYWPYYSRLLMLVYPDEFGNFFDRRDGNFDVDDHTLLHECRPIHGLDSWLKE